MTAVADKQDRKPSPVWLVAAAVTGTLSIVALLGAWTVYREGASEGEIYDHFELGMRAEIDVTA